MACRTREETGTCNHRQCPLPYLSGYNCVEIVAGYCEVGEDCEGLKGECPYAWKGGDWRKNVRANKAFVDFCERLENQPIGLRRF
jgi:hypothetical protein